jgi:hypothetical protein
MVSLPRRREGAASLLMRVSDPQSSDRTVVWKHGFAAVAAKRRLASISPLFATVLLTAAIFLLPATGDGRPARASAGDINAYATHIQYESAAVVPTARK